MAKSKIFLEWKVGFSDKRLALPIKF